jgi:hypothetical protein
LAAETVARARAVDRGVFAREIADAVPEAVAALTRRAVPGAAGFAPPGS